MKKILFCASLLSFSSCSFLNNLQQHCKLDISTTTRGNTIICAMCDSTTAKTLLNKIK